MLKDQCILVDDNDTIVGNASKFDAHRFIPETPHGLLHRAFSVFLFNSQNKLLLQQRAAHKITFPGVWTNTCCSHPLYGQTPVEVDTPADVKTGKVPGARAAAIRKLGARDKAVHRIIIIITIGRKRTLEGLVCVFLGCSVMQCHVILSIHPLMHPSTAHELGIPPHQVPPEAFRFLTRLHYCAPDAHEGEGSEWGEHEMDYILVARVRTLVNGVNDDDNNINNNSNNVSMKPYT